MVSQRLLPEQSFPYLTVIPDRRPQQKVHRNLGQAKGAVSYRDSLSYKSGIAQDCQVYEWKDNQWVLLWDIPAGTTVSGMPWNQKEADNG